MPFDLKNLNPPSRFHWPEDPEGEEWVELRVVSDSDRLELVKKVGIDRKAEFVLNPKTKAMERVEYADTDLEKGERFIHALDDLTIVNWNLKTPDGKKIQCTSENKKILLGGSSGFRKWIDECLEKLQEAETSKEEKLRKNGLSS